MNNKELLRKLAENITGKTEIKKYLKFLEKKQGFVFWKDVKGRVER
jgi:hypothetical protein